MVGRGDKHIVGRDLLSSILGAVDVFSDRHNHTAIRSELALARAFYQDPDSVPARTVELPNYPRRETLLLEVESRQRSCPGGESGEGS